MRSREGRVQWKLPGAWLQPDTSKPRATSFFPLQKLKGSQPAIPPSAWMVHLEEKSALDEEEGVNDEDPDGIKGVTEEFIVHLARAVKDTQQMEKHWLSL